MAQRKAEITQGQIAPGIELSVAGPLQPGDTLAEPSLVYLSASAPGIRELAEDTVQKVRVRCAYCLQSPSSA